MSQQTSSPVASKSIRERIRIDVGADGVADVHLIRTDKMNALDDAMFTALLEAIDFLKADKRVRVVVLSGDGRAFCAGLDMGNFAKMKASVGEKAPAGPEGSACEKPADKPAVARDLGARSHGIANRPQYVVWGWRELPMPVIAAVHGVAFGGGFQLMLGADIRYLAPETRLSIMEIKWGLVPDMAGTLIMHRLVRDDIIRELTYTGRVFSAEEALQYGFATRVVAEPHAAAMALAREIAGKSPTAIRASKRLLDQAPVVTQLAAMTAESVEQQVLIGSANQVEAITANIEKRAARYVD